MAECERCDRVAEVRVSRGVGGVCASMDLCPTHAADRIYELADACVAYELGSTDRFGRLDRIPYRERRLLHEHGRERARKAGERATA